MPCVIPLLFYCFFIKRHKISPFSSYGRPSKEEREREEEQREKQENLGEKFKEKVKKSRKQARW
ncbi:Uncharacterized protein TCM_012930 [Theobroma cacao]|uniref:Uncharacterized protein n=1 Tax=Theobroma cacao TaxID=3641 RepID=A0A061FVY5_THECC|nr:Uncharacterized protein TCM_012930 [Theobroma cacao]